MDEALVPEPFADEARGPLRLGERDPVFVAEQRQIGPEPDDRAGRGLALGRTDVAQLLGQDPRCGRTVARLHETQRERMTATAAPHLGIEASGQTGDDRRAHAVQPAGHLVRPAVELAPCVGLGEHHLERRTTGVRPVLERVDRDASSGIADLDRAVAMEHHDDAVSVATHRLVDGVVDDLPDEMVQARCTHACRAEIHERAMPYVGEPAECLDGRRVVGVDDGHAVPRTDLLGAGAGGGGAHEDGAPPV